jgi:ribose 5-phosphate isomerase A
VNENRSIAWAAAGRAAAGLAVDGARVGLGTGRAAAEGIRSLAGRVAGGLRVTGVPTSNASRALAHDSGIRLGKLVGDLDLAFDGADAVDPTGLTIKGAGGAMVRERIVAEAAARFVVLVDAPKVVASLDEWGILPIACLPFARARLLRTLADLAPVPRPRRSDDGLTLIDLTIPAGTDWRALGRDLASRSGIVDHGIFEISAADVFIGAPDGSCRTLAGQAAE